VDNLLDDQKVASRLTREKNRRYFCGEDKTELTQKAARQYDQPHCTTN
jgi:hypothetical protein